MDSNQTGANVPKSTDGGAGVVSRIGTCCNRNTIVSSTMTQSGLSKLGYKVSTVTNAIIECRFRLLWDLYTMQQLGCAFPRLFDFVSRVLDSRRVALKDFLSGFESSVATYANSLNDPVS